jgi:hypothetical protein
VPENLLRDHRLRQISSHSGPLFHEKKVTIGIEAHFKPFSHNLILDIASEDRLVARIARLHVSTLGNVRVHGLRRYECP